MKQKTSYVILFLLIAVVIGEGLFLISNQEVNLKTNLASVDWVRNLTPFAESKTLEDYAVKMVEKCGNKNPRTCYTEHIPDLMSKMTMEEAFEVTKIVQEKDPKFRYCHVLGHELSAIEAAKDPSKWKSVAARCPSGICSNGCIHGAFQERFRAASLPNKSTEKLTDLMDEICVTRKQWKPTGLERATCYHALGHLTMYATDADIRKSLKLCDEVTKKDNSKSFQPLCYDGVFMQLFQPLEPEDFALIEGMQPSKDELKSYCWQFEGYKRSSCWNEGWPLFSGKIKQPDFISKRCNVLEEEKFKERCFHAMFYITTVQLKFDQNQIRDFCNGFSQQRKEMCFADAASRLIETDYRFANKAINLCKSADEKSRKACFEELLFYSTYNYHPGSKRAMELCSQMPDDWKNKCKERQQKFEDKKNNPYLSKD